MTPTWRAVSAIPVRFLLLAGATAVAAFWFTMSASWDPTGNDAFFRPQPALQRLVSVQGMIAFVLASVPLLALRWPVAAGVIGLLPFLFLVVVPFTDEWPFGLFVAVAGAAMVGMWDRPRQAVVTGALALVPVAHCTLTWSTIQLPDGYSIAFDRPDALTLAVYTGVMTVMLALAWWMRRAALAYRRAAGLAARATEVERTSAVVEERARLARDLHDVVAHHVSLIAVRAETAPYTVPDLPLAGRQLVAEIAADARRALEELRSVLGILRRSVDDPQRAPQPTAAEVPVLVEQALAAGDRVVWQPADLTGVPPGPGYAVYRVVQEALTNARRHAHGKAVHLTTEVDRGEVRIEVANASASRAPVDGGGLAGMRERVEGLGGTLSVGATEGMFVLRAVIPTGGGG